MYTKDTSLSLRNDNMSRLNETLIKDLEALDVWLKGNKLSLNVAKTQSMITSTYQKYDALKHQTVQPNHTSQPIRVCSKYEIPRSLYR